MAKVTFEKGVLTYRGVKARSAVVGMEYGPRHCRANKPLRAVTLRGYDARHNEAIVQRKGQDICITIPIQHFMTEYLVQDLPASAAKSAVEAGSKLAAKSEPPTTHWAEVAIRRMDATIADLSKKMDALIKAHQRVEDRAVQDVLRSSGDLFGSTNGASK